MRQVHHREEPVGIAPACGKAGAQAGLKAGLHAGRGCCHGEVGRGGAAGQVQHARLRRVHRHAAEIVIVGAAEVGGPQNAGGGGVQRLQVDVAVEAARGLGANRVFGQRQIGSVGAEGEIDVLLRVDLYPLRQLEQRLLEDDACVGHHLDEKVVLDRPATPGGAQLQCAQVEPPIRPGGHARGANVIDRVAWREHGVGLQQHQVGCRQPVVAQGNQVQLHVLKATEVGLEFVRPHQHIGRAVGTKREALAGGLGKQPRVGRTADYVHILLPALGVVLGPEGMRALIVRRRATAQVGRVRGAKHVGVAGRVGGRKADHLVAAAAQVGRVAEDRVDHQRQRGVIGANVEPDLEAPGPAASQHKAAIHCLALAADLLVQLRRLLHQVAGRSVQVQVAIGFDFDTERAGKRHAYRVGIRLRRQHPVVFQRAVGPLVVEQVDAGVDLVVEHLRCIGLRRRIGRTGQRRNADRRRRRVIAQRRHDHLCAGARSRRQAEAGAVVVQNNRQAGASGAELRCPSSVDVDASKTQLGRAHRSSTGEGRRSAAGQGRHGVHTNRMDHRRPETVDDNRGLAAGSGIAIPVGRVLPVHAAAVPIGKQQQRRTDGVARKQNARLQRLKYGLALAGKHAALAAGRLDVLHATSAGAV